MHIMETFLVRLTMTKPQSTNTIILYDYASSSQVRRYLYGSWLLALKGKFLSFG